MWIRVCSASTGSMHLILIHVNKSLKKLWNVLNFVVFLTVFWNHSPSGENVLVFINTYLSTSYIAFIDYLSRYCQYQDVLTAWWRIATLKPLAWRWQRFSCLPIDVNLSWVILIPIYIGFPDLFIWNIVNITDYFCFISGILKMSFNFCV